MDHSRINVLFISAWYPDRINPTLGNFVEKHVKAVSLHANVNVLHVAYDADLIDKRYELLMETENNVTTVRVYIKKKFTKFFPFNLIQKLYLYLNAYIKGYNLIVNKFGKPDLLHANIIFPTAFVAMFFKWKYKLNYIITEHWTGYLPDDPSKINYLKKHLAKLAISKAKYITAVSDDLMHAMLAFHLKGNYKVIPNVVDINVFKPNQNKIINNKVRFLHVSSLDDGQKNITGIIKVVNDLTLKGIVNFELLIVSDGDNSLYVNLCKELDLLNKYISFEGAKTTEEIALLMQQSDCFLMFSNYESFSVVIAEALVCGLPVIATDAGGISSTLTKDYGIIIKPGDETALFEAIIYMSQHYFEYDKKLLSAFANNFSYETVSKAFLELYKETIN